MSSYICAVILANQGRILNYDFLVSNTLPSQYESGNLLNILSSFVLSTILLKYIYIYIYGKLEKHLTRSTKFTQTFK